jgi:hypothetical protein
MSLQRKPTIVSIKWLVDVAGFEPAPLRSRGSRGCTDSEGSQSFPVRAKRPASLNDVLNSPTNFNDPLGLDKNKKNDECPPVPPHLDSMNVDRNIAEEKSNAPLLPNLLSAPLVLEDYYQKVRNHGPWDYKQNRTLNDFGSLDVASPYEDFGNFNYGATAGALGIPENVALRAAGYAGQKARGHSMLCRRCDQFFSAENDSRFAGRNGDHHQGG